MTLIFGNVPHPAYRDVLIPDANNYAWDNLGKRKVYGVCQHTMVGGLWGTHNYFNSGAPGLTDYGIGGASDGKDDGLILRWNDPWGYSHPGVSANRWPWASGPCDGCEGDGVAFVNRYGPNAVNGYLVSVERSDGGNPDVPPSAKYLDAFCKLMAYFADQMLVPWDDFPINPATGLTFYYGHYEFSTKSCPAGCRAHEGEVIDRVCAILKAAQTGDEIPVPPEEEDPLANIPKSGYKLDPDLIWPNASTGAVGQLWREYGEATGIWNPPGQPWNDDGGQGCKIYQFEGGPLVAVSSDGNAGIVVQTNE